jgi:hypothetical protein
MLTMESNREKNEKLLSLISEIRELVGDFDTSSILGKLQFDQDRNHDCCLESDNDLTICDRYHPQKVMTLKQPPVWKGKHSPETKRGAPTPFSPAAVRSVTTLRNSDFKLNEVDTADGFSITPNPTTQRNEDELYYHDGSNEQRPSSVHTPQSHQQRRHRLSSSRYAVPLSANRAAATETMEKRNCQSLKKSSIPSERLYGASIPALDISTFLEELPSNSPVRTLISNCIASVSPSRRTSDYIEDRRSSLQRDEISHKKTRNMTDNSTNFLELVCLGANRESLEGSSFLVGSGETEQLSNLNSLQRGKVEILDHFKVGDRDEGFTCIIESITDYCFPDGVVIDVILRTDIVKYAGAKNNSMHVMQFSDVAGSPTYACCLTVTEHIEPKNKGIIRSLLLQKRSYAKAVGIIVKAFRRLLRKRKNLLLNLSKNIAGAEHSIFDRKLSFYSMSTPFKFGSTKVSADVDDSEVKPTGVGFGSAIMSRLKMGISFAGRTTEKPPAAKTPGRKTNKVLWSDLDEDEEEESRGPDGVLRGKEGSKMKFGVVRGINEEDEYDGDEEGADVDEEGDRDTSGDSYRGSRGVFSPAVTLTPDTSNSPHAPSTSPYTTEGTPRGSAPMHHTFDTTSIMSMISSGMDVFSPARRSPIHELPVDVPSAHRAIERGSAVTDRGHSVTELEGLHMHGFSSESEGDDDAETDELESSFESDINIKNKRRSSKEKSIKKRTLYLESETNCHTPGASPPLQNAVRRSSAESDDLQDSIDKFTKLSPGSIADSSISEKDIFTACSTEKEDTAEGNVEDSVGLNGEAVECKGPLKELENVDEYVLVTKKAYCILSLTPMHSFAFAVSTHCAVLLRTILYYHTLHPSVY